MKTASATRFRCRRPLTDLRQLTLMFYTLVPQYLNKLVEGEVRHFSPPKPFHARKVQGFKDNRIKLLTQIGCKLPVKVFPLAADFPIQACELKDTPPPTVRAFLFATQIFVERPKFVQSLFQGLWVLYLFTRAQCQESVFHAKVCPNAFTRCRQRFKTCIGRCDAKPIVSASITLDCDTTGSPMPLAVFMESIGNAVKLPLPFIPFFESERDTIVLQRPPRTSRKGDRFKLMSRFDMRSTAEFIEKSLIRCVNAFEFLLDRLARQGVPMRVRGPFQLGQVRTHRSVVCIRKSIFIALALPLMEIGMHLPHIVKPVAKAYRIRLFSKLILVGFHGISDIRPLTPNKWEGRHIALRQCLLCLPV